MFLLIISSFANAQDETRRYRQAYEYLNSCEIVKDIDKKACRRGDFSTLNVYDSIQPLSLLILNPDIIEDDLANENDDVTMFITNHDMNNNFNPYPVDDLFMKSSSDFYVVFSKPADNYLLAEVVIKKKEMKREELTYDKLIEFNRSIGFLFIFDNEGKLLKVRKSINHYN
ncbi:MAG: hypothetical protein DCO95_10925 [Roseivirga sp. XM-24bin3]|nr:MAG: hypothetical protein DCO95_10925 [Roseivirga sp. XM-24bin3]